jgi:photosystem II stability/assembly factor-like uncharacterized protein
MNFLKNNNFENVLIKIIIIAGFILTGYQFLYNRSLWIDEAMLASNIINKNNFALFKPLHSHQAAPILYLQIEKIFSELIPNSELGLRLFSILSFWLSSLLFVRILKIIQNNYFTIIMSLIIFIFNYRLIYFATELKPYMIDVMVLTSIYYLILRKYKDEKRKYFYLGIAGAISIFLSNISPIILFTVCSYLLYNYFNYNKKNLSLIISISALWCFLFLINYFSFIYKHPLRDIMVIDWIRLNGFMPLNPFSAEFYKFILSKSIMISADFFQLRTIIGVSILYVFLIFGCILMFIKKKYDLIIITIFPIILHLFLSGFKLYPFDTRLILYICPIFIIIFSFVFEFLYFQILSKFRIEYIRLTLIVIAFLKLGYLSSSLPIQRSEIKKSLLYIESKLKNGDMLYVHHNSITAFNYYKDIKFPDNNFLPVIYGRSYITTWFTYKYNIRKSIETCFNDFKNFNGRYWLLFSNIHNNEDSYIVMKLDSLGCRRLDEYNTVGSSVYLYDFNRQWQYSNGPFTGMTITCLETAGTDIFAGTKEGGVFLSTDNGESWTAMNNGLNKANVTSIAISESKVLVATEGGGVFLIKNKGTSWTAMNNGLKNLNVHSLIISGSNVIAGTDRGIFLSTNEGESWTFKSNGLIKSDVYALTAGGSYIYAGTAGTGGDKGGVFLSTDNGGSWKHVNSGLNKLNVYSLAISRGNIFAGTDGGVFLSSDNGATWSPRNNGLINLNVHSIIINRKNIFAGTEGGVFLSTNNGRRWKAVNEGLKDSNINCLALSKTNIFAGTLNTGVWKRILWE